LVKDISHKHQSKESRSFQSKENYQGQIGTVYNNKRVSSPRRYNNPKYICIKQQSCRQMKQKLIELKEMDKTTIKVTDINILLSEAIE